MQVAIIELIEPHEVVRLQNLVRELGETHSLIVYRINKSSEGIFQPRTSSQSAFHGILFEHGVHAELFSNISQKVQHVDVLVPIKIIHHLIHQTNCKYNSPAYSEWTFENFIQDLDKLDDVSAELISRDERALSGSAGRIANLTSRAANLVGE